MRANEKRINDAVDAHANYGVFGESQDAEYSSPTRTTRDGVVWHGRRRTTITNYTEDRLNKEFGFSPEIQQSASPVPVCAFLHPPVSISCSVRL